jgi:hypothetical protein
MTDRLMATDYAIECGYLETHYPGYAKVSTGKEPDNEPSDHP